MTIAIGALIVALALGMYWTPLDFAIPFARGWHVTLWPVPAVIGLALIASAIRRC